MKKLRSVSIQEGDFGKEKTTRVTGDWKRVADALQKDIIFGRLFPRERLVEDVLIERFQTSRHAVRSAFDEMLRRGLIYRETNRGVRVRHFEAREVEELFDVVETLESRAIRRMPMPVSNALLERLVDIQNRHAIASECNETLELFNYNKEFHKTLFEACGNYKLAEAIHNYALLIDPIRMRRIPDKDWRAQAIDHHWQMIEMLRTSDREALVELCASHIEPTKQFYLDLYA